MNKEKKSYDLFIGCYGRQDEETIHWLEFDAKQETIRKVTSFTGIENPSFLTVNRKKNHLYAISEVDNGEVVCFGIDHQEKKIHEINRHFTKGGPCYVELGANEDYIFTANYGGGSIVVHALNENGEIEKETDFITYHSKKSASEVSNVHMITNISKTPYYIATDLGLNKLYVYRFDHVRGHLEQVHEIIMPDGSGPRHITFHPTLNRFYVVNEFNSTVLVYSYDQQLASITLEQVVSTLPDTFEGDNYGAHIETSSSGIYLYASNRGQHAIAVFEILLDGKLKALSHAETKGEWPRHFTNLPDSNFVFVLNEHTDNLIVMKMSESGELQHTGLTYAVNKPVCIHAMPNT